jgi:glucose/arabinose dehydrogenase
VLLVATVLATSCGGDDTTGTGTDDPSTTTTSADDTTSTPIEIDVEAGEMLANEIEGLPQLALVNVVTGLRGPVEMKQAPGDDRMFVLQVRSGQIFIVDDGVVLETPFLDIKERLEANGEGEERGRGERGLLSLAFHPDYQENGRFFVWYADESGIAELAEYTVSDDPDVADPASKVLLREYEESKDHFGGGLQFGPDGFLWLGIGDGGRRPNAQTTESGRGGILRLDVSTPGEAVPAAGNPFIDGPGESGDVWALGLRNPWRWSIDAESGLIFIADVGRDIAEELNVSSLDEGGLNYGWATVEGSECFRLEAADPEPECDRTGFVDPVIDYLHADTEACSMIGGHVYRGDAIPELDGTYLYADFCAGFVRTFDYVDGAVTNEQQLFDNAGAVVSINVDHDGEIYLVSTEGWIRQLVSVEG